MISLLTVSASTSAVRQSLLKLISFLYAFHLRLHEVDERQHLIAAEQAFAIFLVSLFTDVLYCIHNKKEKIREKKNRRSFSISFEKIFFRHLLLNLFETLTL